MHENILIYDVPCKTLIGTKPLHIRFNQIHGFIRIYDATRYLVLFDSEKYDAIYIRIRYLISPKSAVSKMFFLNKKRKLILIILYLYKKY